VLRHTFATTALRKGISLPTVQKIPGHDSFQTTAIVLQTPILGEQPRWLLGQSVAGEGNPPPGGSQSVGLVAEGPEVKRAGIQDTNDYTTSRHSWHP